MDITDLRKAATEATYQSANETLRTTVTMNAGGVAALLTFIGAAKISNPAVLSWSFFFFASGMVVSAFGLMAAYLTNFHTFRWTTYNEDMSRSREEWFGIATFLFVFLAVMTFAGGAGYVWWQLDKLAFVASDCVVNR